MIYHFVPRIIGPLLYSFEKSHKVQFRILQGEDTPNLNLNINKSNILGFYSKYFKYKINSHEIYQKITHTTYQTHDCYEYYEYWEGIKGERFLD